MKIRDRVKELRRVEARTLRPNPRNWRTHPEPQRDALRGVLSEIGYAGALLARELEDGSLELIDGHLRAETTPEQHVPVLVLDVSREEADKLLAVIDPLANMAETDSVALAGLLEQADIENDALRAMVGSLLTGGIDKDASPAAPREEVDIPEVFQVVVECRDEDEQRDVYEQLTTDGRRCRLLHL